MCVRKEGRTSIDNNKFMNTIFGRFTRELNQWEKLHDDFMKCV